MSYGCHGIFHQEVKSALYGGDARPPVFGFVAGLGGRDITLDSFREIASHTLSHKRPEDDIVWIGVKK